MIRYKKYRISAYSLLLLFFFITSCVNSQSNSTLPAYNSERAFLLRKLKMMKALDDAILAMIARANNLLRNQRKLSAKEKGVICTSLESIPGYIAWFNAVLDEVRNYNEEILLADKEQAIYNRLKKRLHFYNNQIMPAYFVFKEMVERYCETSTLLISVDLSRKSLKGFLRILI